MPHKPIPRTPAGGDPAEELLAILAHELRRPLTALLGALATLQQRHHALSVRQQQELLGIAHRQGEQLGQLLDQLLAAAEIDRGQGRLARRSLVDAAALAEEAGRAARLAHPHHQITIEVAGPLLVRADPLAVSRILGNLLDNVAAYSPPGATIWLSARRDGMPRWWPSRTPARGSTGGPGPDLPALHPTAPANRPSRQRWGLALACTSPGGWLAPTVASCPSPTPPMAAASVSNCVCRWPLQHRAASPPRQ